MGLEPESGPGEVAAPPSGVRFIVLFFLCTLGFVLYIDRVCISQAVIPIRNELGLDNQDMGFILAAFTLAYGLFEVPTGWLGDRYGTRGVLTRIVLWWSVFTTVTGAAFGFWSLLIVRFLFGAGEAGAYPNAARVLARWYAPQARGRVQGLMGMCALLGGAASPMLAAYFIDTIGWRLTFALFGLIGAAWALPFYWLFRDDPAEHPRVNRAELALIRAGSDAARDEQTPHPPVPWRLVFNSLNIWLMGAIMSCGAGLFYLFISWYPTYLQDGRGVQGAEASRLAALVLGGGALGCILGGFANDYVQRLTGERRRSRRWLGTGSFAAGGLAFLCSLHSDDALMAALWLALACLCAMLPIAAWWAVAMEISGKHLGALFGLMNSMGIPGAIVSQLLVGYLVKQRGLLGFTGRDQWDPPLYFYVGLMAIGALCWSLLDPYRPVEEVSSPSN